MRTLPFDEFGVHKFCEHLFFVFDRPVDEKSLDFSIQLWLAVAFDRQHPSKFGDDVVVQVENEQLRGEIDDLLDADVAYDPSAPAEPGRPMAFPTSATLSEKKSVHASNMACLLLYACIKRAA